MKKWRQDHRIPDLGADITRRDFLGATLIGAGAALLRPPSPAQAQTLGSAWTGYGGVGDYRFSNGNTAEVVASAHKIRDGAYDERLADVIDTGEQYDVAIVGGGFAGLTAMYEFKKRKPNSTCLLIDNHPIFGGFAKSNEFDVDGYRVAGAQASINFLLPGPATGATADYWHELGLPDRFQFAPQEGGDRSIVFPKATSSAVYWAEQCASIGYYFQNPLTNGKGVWVRDIWNDNLKRAPWPDSLKKDLLALRDSKRQYKDDRAEPAWLDSMTYADFVTRVMGLSPQVLSYIAPIMGIVGQFPQVSAYAAGGFPGVNRSAGRSPLGELGDRWISFPGGNATLLRHFVKAILPEAIQGPKTFEAIANNPVNFSATADSVSIVYQKDRRLYRVRARGAVLAIGSWVAKHIVTDLPHEYRTAFDQFLYGPILMVNVALRNWRFLDRLGFAAARWFDGFGFYSTVRQPMLVGHRPTPFHPDKPIVMTFYIPIQHPDLPLVVQGSAGRAQLYGTSYAQYERQIVAQMQRMFAAGGFDASRDIAGIVLNRWGHAFIAPPPGFYFGKDGGPPPLKILRQQFGRIAFGHSELSGDQSRESATVEGKRAVTQILETLEA